MTIAKIAELNWEIMPHPPYSPDLSPTDFHLFLRLDHHMKNRTFNIEDDLKTEVHNFFQSRTKDFYKNGITKLRNLWEKAIECEGSYFDEQIHLIIWVTIFGKAKIGPMDGNFARDQIYGLFINFFNKIGTLKFSSRPDL